MQLTSQFSRWVSLARSTFYKATHHVMSALGLDAQAISKLTTALHVHGLTTTDSILSTCKFLSTVVRYRARAARAASGPALPYLHHQCICHSTSADWAPARRHHRHFTTSACWHGEG